MHTHVHYLSALRPKQFQKTVDDMAKMIKSKFPECNMIFGRGLSGTMLIPALAAKLLVEWAIIRKGNDSHSDYQTEVSEWLPENKAVFVDDLIDTGGTYKSCVEELRKKLNKRNSYVRERFEKVSLDIIGAVLYQYSTTNTLDVPAFSLSF